jgi:hypothetical protein
MTPRAERISAGGTLAMIGKVVLNTSCRLSKKFIPSTSLPLSKRITHDDYQFMLELL